MVISLYSPFNQLIIKEYSKTLKFKSLGKFLLNFHPTLSNLTDSSLTNSSIHEENTTGQSYFRSWKGLGGKQP